MQSMEAQGVVEGYLEAVGRRDFAAARDFLADRGFEYISPIARSGDADEFVSNMEHGAGAILHHMESRLSFVSGDDVCHVLDVTVGMDGYETQTVVHLARVEGGRIVRLEVIFDASNFNRMIGNKDQA